MTVFKSRAFEVAAAAMMLVDRSLAIVDLNAAAREIFRQNLDAVRETWPGFDPEALIGAYVLRLHNDPDGFRALLADPANLPDESELSFGAARLSLRVAAVLDDAGGYVGCTLQWRDVRVERVHRSFIESIGRNQLMIEYDPELRVLSVNDNFKTVFGHGDEVIGRDIVSLFGANDDLAAGMQQLREGQMVSRRLWRPARDGGRIWLDVALSAILTAEGEVDRIIEVSSDVTEAEDARLAAEAERIAQTAAQKQVVDDLRRGLSQLAEGNLTETLSEPFAPEYDQLREDYNTANRQLAEALARLIAASGNINAGAVEISQAADDLSRRTENQAAMLEQTAAALDELTTSVQSATEGAIAADEAVKSARESAEDSGRVVVEAVDAMRPPNTVAWLWPVDCTFRRSSSLPSSRNTKVAPSSGIAPECSRKQETPTPRNFPRRCASVRRFANSP
jgi:methyl-accepting chemotaxis protein